MKKWIVGMFMVTSILSVADTTNKSSLDIISGKKSAIKQVATDFDYYSTSTYTIYSKVDFLTALKLNSDEEITYIGGGDTKNWIIDTERGGSDNSEFIYLKPLDKGLKTNLYVLTNKRSYFLTLISTDKEYNPLIQWNYPFEREIAVLKKKQENRTQDVEIKSKDLTSINFNYSISGSWEIRPKQVFNDELKTVLVMPEKLQEMPVVYVKGLDGELSIVNYRVLKNRIIIDKLVNEIQLVLGKKVVKITKY